MSNEDRGYRRLEQLLQSREFQDYIEKLRLQDEFQRIVAVNLVLNKFNLLSKYGYLIGKYIEEGVVDKSLITEPIRVVQGNRGTISLVLSHDVSRQEINQYLDDHWSTAIKPLLPGFGESIRQEIPSTKRDENIISDYLNKKRNSLTNQGIALKNSVSIAHVNRVIKRHKQSHHK